MGSGQGVRTDGRENDETKPTASTHSKIKTKFFLEHGSRERIFIAPAL